MADIYKIGVNIALTNNVSQVLAVISRDLLGVNAKASQLQGTFNRVKLAAIGAAGLIGGAAVLAGMGKLIGHGERLVHQQSLMRQAGIDELDITRARAAAYQTMGDVLGTGVVENLALLGDLRNRLGDVGKAIQALPEMAKVGVVLSAGGGQSAEKAGDDFARFLELRGALVNPVTEQIDADRLKGQARLGEAIAVATRFKVGPTELLGFQQQARAAGASLSDQGLINMVPYIQAGGGQRTGTQLSSLLQQTIGGVMTKAGAEFFEQAGLLNASRVTVGKGGHISINDRDGQAWKNEDQLRHDTASWVDQTLRAGLVGMGAKTVDSQTLAVMRSHLRATVVGLLVEGIRSAPAFNKDAALVNVARGTDQYGVMMGIPQPQSDGRRDRDAYGAAELVAPPVDPTASMKAFKEAWDNLLTALGAPMVETAYRMLGKATQGLTDLSQWASKHEDLVKVIEGVTAGLAVTAVVLGGVALGVAAISAAGFAALPAALIGLAAGIVAVASAIPDLKAKIANMIPDLPDWLKPKLDPNGKTPLETLREQGGAYRGPAFVPDEQHPLSAPNGVPHAGPTFGPQIQRQSYVPPPQTLQPQNISAEGNLILKDGTNLGKYTASFITKTMSGPNKGTTGFDQRTNFGGLMPA